MWAVEADCSFEAQSVTLTGGEAEVERGEEIDVVSCLEIRLSLHLTCGVGVLHTQPSTEVPLG